MSMQQWVSPRERQRLALEELHTSRKNFQRFLLKLSTILLIASSLFFFVQAIFQNILIWHIRMRWNFLLWSVELVFLAIGVFLLLLIMLSIVLRKNALDDVTIEPKNDHPGTFSI